MINRFAFLKVNNSCDRCSMLKRFPRTIDDLSIPVLQLCKPSGMSGERFERILIKLIPDSLDKRIRFCFFIFYEVHFFKPCYRIINR